MIQIYAPDNTNFDMNGNEVLIPEMCDMLAELGGAWSLEMVHPIDDEGRWKHIVKEAVIAVPTFMGKKQLFRIDETDKQDMEITVTAYPIFFDAADEVFLMDTRPTDKSGQGALNEITKGTKYSGESDISIINTGYFIRRNLMSCINGDAPSFLSLWGGEPLYDNFKVIINQFAGGDYGAEVRYGKNMNGISFKEDMSEVVTRIVPVAYNGRTLSTNYVDSPLINNYAKVYIKEIKFEEVRYYEDVDENTDTEGLIVCNSQKELDVALIEKCNAQFEAGIDIYRVTIDIDMVAIEDTEEYKDFKDLVKIGLGDIVMCRNSRLDISTKARAIKIKWDCITDSVKEVTLGDYEKNFIEEWSTSIDKKMENYDSELTLIKSAIVNTLTVNEADIRYAQIEQLDVIEANVTNMVVGTIDGRYATLEFVTSNYITTGVFEALSGKVGILETDMLTAESSIIKELQTDITRTNTLIFGSASGESIQTEFSNSVIAQLGDAQIKSAMIDNLSADKITGLDLNTTKFTVHSEDGKSTWIDNTIQISDGARVRVQIGKDASDDYSMYVWDKSGNLMFDALGLTEDGISRPIIRNDMVHDNAGIDAKKLDISSLFKVINEDGSHSLNATKIYIDTEGQTLNVAFQKMTTDVAVALSQSGTNTTDIEALKEIVTTQGTEVSVLQGQILSKIWQQDIRSAVDSVENEVNVLNTQYSTLNQTVGSLSTTIGSHTTEIGGLDTRVSNTESNYEQLANKFSWIVKSGTSASNFTITDRMASLTAQYINLNGLVTFGGLDSGLTTAIQEAVKSVDVMYALGTSTTTAPTSGWSTTAPTWVSGKYMWQKTVTTYADGSTAETSATCISGATGQTGATGATGAAGKGVKSITNYYLASSSSSGVTTSTSGWTTSVQTITTSKKYLWNYEVITYTDNTTTTTTPCIIGAYGNTGTAGAKGATGATGNGISSIAEYYAVSSSNSTAPTSWSTTVPTMTTTNKYLWNYEIITYTNGTTEETAKRVIGVYGNTGEKGATGATGPTGATGATGAAGKGVKSITNYYLASSSSSGVTTSTSGWTTSVQTITTSKKYLWNYEVITYTDSTTTTTTPCIIGAYGNTGTAGAKGATGATGNGISSIAEYYAVSSSNSTAPTSWSTTVPTMTTTNKYLWNYEIITYTNGTTEETAKRVIGVYGNTGEKGATGATGATGAVGKGVKSIVEQYYLSSSSSSQTGGSWSSTCPTWKSGYYIWTRSYITWSDSTTTTTTPVLANGINNANTTANTANTNASNALSTANTANTNASTALSTANTANNTASSALSTANSANTNATNALNRATYHYGTCSTAAATVAKVVTLSNFTLYTGAMISVYFTYANTASSPTLNVNGTGAKAIRVNNAAITTKYYWQAKNTVTFIYNGTYWVMADTSANSILANWCSSNDKTLIDGAKIYTGSITAAKISVTDLSAFNATIGGWDIATTGITKTAQAWIGPTYDDLLYCNKISLGTVSVTSAKKKLYDLDADGTVDVFDIIRMNNLLRGGSDIEDFASYTATKTDVTVKISPDAEKVIHMYGTNVFGTYVESYLSAARLKVPTVVADGATFKTVNIDSADSGLAALNVNGDVSISGALTAESVQTISGADLDTLNNKLVDTGWISLSSSYTLLGRKIGSFICLRMLTHNVPAGTTIGNIPAAWGTSSRMTLLPSFSGNGAWLQINANSNAITQVAGTDCRGTWSFFL